MVLQLTLGLILICNSLLTGFALYYCITLILSHITYSQVQRPSQFVFKLILCCFFINFSKSFCFYLININYFFSLAIRSLGEEVLGTEICFTNFINHINTLFPVTSGNFNLFSFDGLIRALMSIGFINLVLSYSLRYIMIEVFCLISPFAIITLIIDKCSWFFKAWIKAFLSLLFLQILVAFILLIAFSLERLENSTFVSLLYIGSIYALIRANSFIRDLMGGLSTDVSANISSIKSLFTKNY